MSGGMDFWNRNKLRMIGSTKVRVDFVLCQCAHAWLCLYTHFLLIDVKCLLWGVFLVCFLSAYYHARGTTSGSGCFIRRTSTRCESDVSGIDLLFAFAV